jgi:hypothetical protein
MNTRHAQTRMRLQPGGRAVPGVRSLYCLNGWAKDVEAVSGKRAQPPYPLAQYGSMTPLFEEANLPDETIGSLGALGSDGNLWVTLPDGGTPVDATLNAPRNFYAYSLSSQEYKLTLTASSSTTNADLSTTTPEFCVGQTIYLQASWSPGLPGGTQKWAEWTLGGDFIDNFYYPSGYSNPSLIYTNDPNYLTNESAQAWWKSGDYDNPPAYRANFSEALNFANGQYASVAAAGNITVYRPTISNFIPDNPISVVLGTNSLPEIYLGIGDPSSSGQGAMGWDLSVHWKPNFKGTFFYTQLIDREWSWDITTFHLPRSHSTGNTYWLDNESPYTAASVIDTTGSGYGAYTQATMIYGDGPSLSDSFYSFADLADSFNTYLEFQPVGGIPVTIGRVTWGWHGQTAASGGVWSLAIGDVTGPSLNDSDDTFPVWTTVYYNSNN